MKVRNFLILIVIFNVVGFIQSKITKLNMGWYNIIHKSSLTPPNYVFPVAWGLLYLMQAITATYILERRNEKGARPILIVFVVQLIVNWCWTPIFFGLHKVNLALAIIASMIFLTIIIIYLSYRKYKPVTYLFIPYLGWITFAGYLNYIICTSN